MASVNNVSCGSCSNFCVACYKGAATYRNHISIVCLSVTKLVRTTPQKLFYPNLTGKISIKSSCTANVIE